ncbi:MAG: hypothetical protein AB7O43_08125 [Hyphomicrobiaceae bacterium]
MSIRLHALGFPADWTAETARLILDLAHANVRIVETIGGRYRLWRSREGAEVWFHEPDTSRSAGRRGANRPHPSLRSPAALEAIEAGAIEQAGLGITAATPFHRGLSDCTLRIKRYLAVDRDNPLEGSCQALLPPAADGMNEQPLIVELAPFGLHPPHRLPHKVKAQVLCCAHAVWAFESSARYLDGTPRYRRIATGSVTPVSEADVPDVPFTYHGSPMTLGLATGVIKRSFRHMNPATGMPYYWMLLETSHGAFDVVANPDQVFGDISEGHVAQVCGSFLARLADMIA